MRLQKSLLVLAIAATVVLAGCGTQRFIDNAQRINMTEQDLQAEGREQHQQLVNAKALYEDPALSGYLNRVGQRMVRNAQQRQGMDKTLIFRFFVLDDADVNAYASPGGYVYLTRGMLAMLKTEDELAAVIGHELAHVSAGHSLKSARQSAKRGMLSSLGSMGLSVLGAITFNPLLLGAASANETMGSATNSLLDQRNAREMELEADALGKRYSVSAGYDAAAPAAVIANLENFSQWNKARAEARGIDPAQVWGLLASHPDNQMRRDRLKAQAVAGAARLAPEGDYLNALNGLVYGFPDRVGVHRGARFYSSTHALSMPVPQGWYSSQDLSDASVTLFAPKNTSRIVFIAEDLSNRTDAAGFAKTYFDGLKLSPAAKMPAVLGTAGWRGSTQYKGVPLQILVWVKDDRGYVLLGRRDSDSPMADAAFISLYERTVAGIKPLSDAERAQAKAIRLQLATTAQGSGKYAELAKDGPLGPETLGALRVLNGQYGTSAEPATGARVKVLR